MSVQFETRPVRGSRGPNPALLLAAGLAAFVLVAIVKPWDSAEPASAPLPAPSAASSARAVASVPVPSPAPAGGTGASDWTPELTAVLRRHGPEIARSVSLGWQLGIRAVTWKGLFPGTSIATAPLYGSMLEWWYPAAEGRRSGWTSDPLAIVAPWDRAPVLALGVTTGVGDDAVDVRFWRLTESGVERLAPVDVSGQRSGDRLFLPPAALAPDGGWPEGRYVAEVLLGSGIAAIPFRIGDGNGPAQPAPPPVVTMPGVAELARALSDRGVFVVDGRGAIVVEPAAPISRLDPTRAWLAMGDPPTEAAPRIARFETPAPVVAGVTLPDGSVLQSASLWGVSPFAVPMEAARFVNPVGSPMRFVAFAPPIGGAWPAGTYRITARYWDGAYRLTERSWHFDVGVDPSGPVPLLLAGVGRWAGEAGRWSVLSTVGSAGTNRTVGDTLASPRDPQDVPMRPERLDEMCPGSAHVDRASPLIGVGFPTDARVSGLRLLRRYAGGGSGPIEVPSVLLPAMGLALFAAPPETHGTWREGYYDIQIALSPGPPRYLPLCIGRDAGSAFLFRVDPSAAVEPRSGAMVP
jgi:hypothetical protein